MLPELPRDENLRGFLAGPEDEHLEFKSSIRDPRSVARVLAALANSGGGVVAVGVHERQGVVGVEDVDQTEDRLLAAARLVAPPPEVHVERREVDGRTVILAAVSGDGGPRVAPDGSVARRAPDGRSIPLPVPVALEALARFTGTAGASDDKRDRAVLEELLNRLSRMDAHQEEEIRRASDERTAAARERADQAEERATAAEGRAEASEERAIDAEQRLLARSRHKELRHWRDEMRGFAAEARRARGCWPTLAGWFGSGVAGFLLGLLARELLGVG